MSESRFDPNDPRLTAYVLGELDETERAAVERQLEDCAQSRTAVEEIRNLTGLLSEQLPSEPAPVLTEAQRDSVVTAAEKVFVADNVTPSRRGHRWVLVTAASTLAAAGLLMALSPAFRSEVLTASKYYLFTDSDDADFDNIVALNESAEEQYKAALLRETVIGEYAGAEGNGGSAPGGAVPGATDDFLTVNGMEITADRDRGHFELPPEASTQQLGKNAARTNAGSIVTNEQAEASRNYSLGLSFKLPITEREEAAKPASGKVSINSTSRPNIANQPAGAASWTPAVGTVISEQVARDSKRERVARQTFDFQLDDKPRLIRDQSVKEPGLRLKLRETSLGRKISPGSSEAPLPIPAAGIGGLPEYGDIRQIITSPLPPQVAGEWSDEVIHGGAANKLLATKEAEELNQYLNEYLERQAEGESYAPIIENEFLSPLKSPLSTFGIDVDTAAYSNVRRFLNQGSLPPRNAVRIEELVNYFHYDEPEPAGDDPFSVSLEAADCPWNPGHRLVRIGLKGREIDRSKRPHSNLVFLIDVSGSMKNANKLPLVRTALEMLTQQMTENDRIAIVTYASEATLKLDSTYGHNKKTILKAIRSLKANGSTNGEAGIQLAYAKAYEHRIAEGTNRVILCTDGDFNVGVSDDDELMQMVHKYADQSGVFLSIFGFGMGNLKDAKLEKLADKGNGHYGYIDNKQEAHKVFVEELTGTLYTIAKDLKLQIEFNPYQVGAYRLIGYENRLLAAEDFDDDRKDAGDVGAGHSVTALFEIIPLDKLRQPVELKYQKVSRGERDASDVHEKQADPNRELLTLFLRYKQPDGQKSLKREYPLADIPNNSASAAPSENLQWSAAVAAFGMVIRDSQYRGHANYDLVRELALSARGEDESGRRKEFLELVKQAQTIHKQLLSLRSSKTEQIPQSKPQTKQDQPASQNPPLEIGKTVQYWQTHQTNGHDAAKVIKVLNVLFPNMKTKPGANSGEVIILARKSHHDKLADLLPRLTLD